MAGAAFQGFRPVEVIAIILPFHIFAFDDFALYLSMNREGSSERLPCTFVLTHAFSNNILCALKSLFHAEINYGLKTMDYGL